MRILVVTQYFWPESFKVNDLVQELKNRGHEVTVYTGLPNYPAGEFFKGYSYKGPYNEDYDGVKVIRAPLVPRGKGLGYKLVLNYLSFMIFSTVLAPFRVRGDYDRIFIYQLSPFFACLPAIALRFFKRAPVINWVTDLWPESLNAAGVVKNKKLLGLVGIFVKFVYSYSDKIYISSQGFRAKVREHFVPDEKITFWPQWAETFFQAYDPSKNTYHDEALESFCTPDNFVVLFAGNIGTSQDMPTLVEAASMLRQQGHMNIHIAILGDGVGREWMVKEVERRGLTGMFHYLGRKPIETMPYYYNKASALFVSLARTELFSITLPSKLQTYLASGKPILAALDGEGGEIVREWKAGLSCPASEAEKLADTILKFSRLSPEEVKEMGANATKCYLANFEREKLISQLEADFESLTYQN